MFLPLDYEYDEYEVWYAYYDEIENMFYYDGGYVNHIIHDIMTPNEVMIFKYNKEDVIVKNKSGDIYVVYYYCGLEYLSEDEI